ncbi:hypothetical protein R1flu_019719 [Riccia fluitans]|uniref:Uncharacterized protein n=1 Tax=Riccia fluitans TaxID=41844 RepID=A0ABD1ZLM3_9MARC
MRLRRSLQFTCDQLGKYGQMKEFFLDIVAVHLGRKCKDVELICREEDAIHMNTLKQMSMVKHVEQENSDGSFEPVVQVHGLLVGEAHRMDKTSEPGRRMVVDLMNRALAYLRKAKYSSVYAQPLDMINVRYLELLGTNIRMRNGCREVPSSLKFLRVRRSCLPFPLEGLWQLVFLDVDLQMDLIHNVQSIQELKLANSVTLKGIGPLWKLRTAHVKNCSNFEEIKEVEELTELRIVNNPEFCVSCVTGLMRLKTLSLVELRFKEFPEACLIRPEVESVDLSGNINLKEFPMFAKGNAIKKLNLRFLPNLELRGISRKDLSELVKKTEGRDPTFRILGGQVKDEDCCTGRMFRKEVREC